MGWVLCCFRPKVPAELCTAVERPCIAGNAKQPSPSKAATSSSLGGCLATTNGNLDEPPHRHLVHAGSSRVRKAASQQQQGLRLSEDTVASALSTTPTSLNPLSYFLPFVSDDHDGSSLGFTREEVDALGSAPPQQALSKVEFVDLCGSLEDLVYLGEGSNGVVYSASWHGARVAVKFLLGNNDDSTHLQRCFTEAVLTRVLSHPCVVQCFATAIAQLTPETWEAIRARCRRHQSILQSTSLGRSVAAAVLQQQEQDVQEQQQRQQQQHIKNWEQLQTRGVPQQPAPLAALPIAGSLRRPRQEQPGPLQSSLNVLHHQQTHPHAHPHKDAANPGSQQPQPQQEQHQQGHPAHRARSHPQLPLPLPPDRARRQQSRAGSIPSGPIMASGATLPSGITLPSGANLPSGASGPLGALEDAAYEQEREQGRLEMRKVAKMFFAEEEEEEAGLQSPQPAECMGDVEGRRHSSVDLSTEGHGTGDADVDGEGQGDGEGVGEGVSLLQALIDLKAEAGRHCTVVVMEYMDAGTLHQAIVRGNFSARRSVEHRTKLLSLLLTAQELAQGMAHLHGLDILHGDLKPTNVLLKGTPCQYAGARGSVGGVTCTDPRGYTAKIADLGLARTCPGETAQLSSDQWGALAYLAPEAAKGSCCKASDVYSFGVMLWEMSAGVRPYLGLTTPQVLMGLVTGTLQLTWPSDGSLYAPLRSLATACTDFNAAERPTFEVAARVLGRMVRHIRSAAEPLRQRHSSALSMEIAGAGGGGSGGHSASSGKCMLNHASRSMPLYMPTTLTNANGAGEAGAGGGLCGGAGAVGGLSGGWGGGGGLLGSLPSTPSGRGLQRGPGALGNAPWASVLEATGVGGGAASGRQCGGGGEGAAAGAILPILIPVSYSCGGGRPAVMAAASALGRGGAGGTVSSLNGRGSASGCIRAGPVADAGWVPGVGSAAGMVAAAAAQQAYPRMRRGCGSNVCGGPVRSPLGAAASLRVMPSVPMEEAVREAVWAAPSPPLAERPGSSPAHTHVR